MVDGAGELLVVVLLALLSTQAGPAAPIEEGHFAAITRVMETKWVR